MKCDHMKIAIDDDLLIEGIAKAIKIQFNGNPPQCVEFNLKVCASLISEIANRVEMLTCDLPRLANFSTISGIINYLKPEKNPDVESIINNMLEGCPSDRRDEFHARALKDLNKAIFNLTGNESFLGKGFH